MKDINKVHDLTGQKFGLLKVLGLEETNTRKTYWKCLCECGNIKTVRSDSLQCGAIRSCGCIKKQQDRINLTANHSHKMSKTRLYHIWQNMKSRCSNPNNQDYQRYGGRGIAVCKEWENSFSEFMKWANKSGYSETLSIDRIDFNGNYEPNNCRWATPKQQSNNRSSNHLVTIGKETMNISQWCEKYGIKLSVIRGKIRRNPKKPIEDIISELIPR